MQGFNMGRYRPPSTLDSTLSADSPTRQTKRSGSGSSAGATPQVVRFEMPFAIWCTTCAPKSSTELIGQGVRFNAQKRRVGNYFSTPLWSFRMKHTPCGGWIEIRTDPKNAEYVVADGARRRDTGNDEEVAERTGAKVLKTQEEKGRLDALEALEGKKEEKAQAREEVKRVGELWSLRQRDWKDPDDRNRILRAKFRVGRKKREKDAEDGERLKERMGFGYDLVDLDDRDRRRAQLVEFGEFADAQEGEAARKATAKPIFGSGAAERGSKSKVSKAASLQKELQASTRARLNPFGVDESAATAGFQAIPGIKRKRGGDGTSLQSSSAENLSEGIQQPASNGGSPALDSVRSDAGTMNITSNPKSLVAYGSDSD